MEEECLAPSLPQVIHRPLDVDGKVFLAAVSPRG
jgi:hypothetical protein